MEFVCLGNICIYMESGLDDEPWAQPNENIKLKNNSCNRNEANYQGTV